jgi:hypothetical protein
LKEQADCASAIAVESEGVDAIYILRNIAGENCDEECCGYPTDLSAKFPKK